MSKTSLYRVYDAQDRLLYVGISSNWFGRVAQHAHDKDWWGDVATIKVQAFEDRVEAIAAEIQAIRAEHPLHNTQHRRIEWVPASPEFKATLNRWSVMAEARLVTLKESRDLDAIQEHYEYIRSFYQWIADRRADVMLSCHERLGASHTDLAEVTELTRARVGQLIKSARRRREQKETSP